MATVNRGAAWRHRGGTVLAEDRETDDEQQDDENGADPIPFPLYRLILRWAIKANNIMVWFWTLAQWNFIARSTSIDQLKLSNLRTGPGSLIGKYNNRKTDKQGERQSEKNIYADPFEWTLCFWTGLGVWCALKAQEMQSTNQYLFLSPGAKEGTASTKYCEQLSTLAKDHLAEIQSHMDPKRFSPYGVRLGAAIHAIAGAAVPHPIPSVARRAEWSIGLVLDLYWHFGSVGDEHVGRILAGLDPNLDESFDVLPPHFKATAPMADPDIKQGMEMMYGPIIDDNPCHIPVLLCAFACVVYHSPSLLLEVVHNPQHSFSNLTILQETALLERLRAKVTIQPTD